MHAATCFFFVIYMREVVCGVCIKVCHSMNPNEYVVCVCSYSYVSLCHITFIIFIFFVYLKDLLKCRIMCCCVMCVVVV